MNDNSRFRFHLTVVGVFAAALLAIVVLMTMNQASAIVIGDAYPGYGDWVITQPTTVIDESITVLDGDIILNADMRVWNSVIYMELMLDTEYHTINVPAGRTLQSNDSTFESYWDYFNLDVRGRLFTDNVDFNWLNWTSISGTALCNDTHIYYSIAGVQMDGTIVYANGSIQRVYMGFNITSTAMFYNTRIYYSDPGMIVSGTTTFSYCTIENQYNTMTWSGAVSEDNSSLRYVYEFNITGRTSFMDTYLYRIYGGMNMPGTVTITNGDLNYIYHFNATGTVTVYNTTHYRMYLGMDLTGTVSIDMCSYMYNYEGIYVDSDNVMVSNTRFNYMYDSGFTFMDCTASLNNVTIDVYSGTARGYFTSDHVGLWDDRYTMAMGLGIWVIGGNPSFVDVDVEADSTAEFHLDWTGDDADVRVYVREFIAAVMIDSVEMKTVSGLSVHDSRMNARTYMTATNPGTNPLYFNSDVEIRTAGIGIIDYSNVTVTDVEVWNNYFGSHSGPYMSGGYYGGGGGWYTSSRQQVTALVTGDFTSSPSPMFTLRDIEISDGSDWFHLYYNPTYSGTGVPTYANNVHIENVTVTYARNRVFWFELRTSDKDPRDFDINTRVTDCHFEGLSSQVLYYYFWPGEGMDPATPTVNIDEMFRFDNNTITQSTYSWTYVDIGSGGNNMPNDEWDKMVLIADNDFVNTQGVFFYTWAHWSFKKGNDMFYMINNNLENVSIQWDGPFYVYEYDTVRVLGNTFKDMAAGRTADLYDGGGSSAGLTPADWLFKDNTWDNCTNSQWAEVLFLEFGGDVVFDGNEVMNQNGLVSMMPWMEYTGASSMDIINNKFHDNTAYFVEYGNPDADFPNFMMTIRSNEVYNNEDFFLNYWGSTSTLTNFDYDGTFIIEDNDFHDNAGGCIHAWGDVSVENNTFTNNAGPLLYIDYINLNVPYVADNVMANNVDLFMFEAKDRGYQLVAMNLTDQTLTCTGTALHLTNMEVTLEQVDIVGAETAILAWNTFVDAYGCTIDGDTCRVVADGLITTWWSIEAYVTWGDKDGTDSGTPVSEALIVFNTASGDYYSSAYANTGGMLADELYQQWSVDLGGVYWYSPYTMKVAASGATDDTEVVLDRDLIGDDKIHLILWDVFPPVVAITEPFDGAIFAKSSVETFGFVAEVGSGLEMVEYSTDGGDNWAPMNIAGTGDWTLTLSDLADGEATLMVRAKDVAGNIAESKVTMTIDTTPPALSINPLPSITNVPEVSITGSVEVGAEVFLNGKTLGISVDPTLSIDHTLHEGVNVIVVEAMDTAGNMAIQTLTVTLDTIEPVLVINGPANMLVTNADSVSVTGIVEVGTTLTVGGTQVVPDETGAFSHDHTLSSGENSIEVKATDDATNVNMVTIMVYQDQDPPALDITSPEDGHITDQGMVQVTVVSDDDAMVWLNGRMLQDTGTATRSVLLVEGENAITARAVDPAGNEAVVTITVTRDTEPPSLVITSPDVMEVMTNAVNLDVEGIALKATSVTAGGVNGDLDEVTGVFTVSVPLSVGENNITVEASDGVNVVSQTIHVMVSRTPPILQVASQEAVVRTPSVTITGETAAGIKEVTVTYPGFEGVFPVEYDGTFAVTLNLVDGDYDVQVSVTDAFGNTAIAATGSFTVKAKDISGPDGDGGGLSVEPIHIGLILAVIGIALIIAAYASANYITKRRREELEEND